MQRFSWRLVLIAGALGLSLTAFAQSNSPAPQQLLDYQPTPAGVSVAASIPSPAELAQCKVEFANGPRGGAWVLKDPQGRLLRKFAFVDGSKIPNELSFFRDGFEVYRESITAGKKQADKFTWLGLGGMKIGLDQNGDKKIDVWQALSMEELSQEVVRAAASKDWSAYQPLLISQAELSQLGAPAKEVQRILELQKTAPARFQELTAKLAHLNASTKWLHLETGSPSRMLAETTGMKGDVLMHYRALILCETAGKTDSIQLGEIVQVGDCWKLLDAPLGNNPNQSAVFAANPQPQGAAPKEENPALTKAMESLAELDKNAPASAVGPNKAVAAYHLERAGRIRKVYELAKGADQTTWFKQMVDSLSAAAQASPTGDEKAQKELNALAAYLTTERPGSELSAYVNYRAITSDYAAKSVGVAKAETMVELQKGYLANLERFVAAHPKAEETAEALLQMGMILDFQDKSEEAKKWYAQCAKDFGGARQGAKATGALRRLNAVGQPWEAPAGAAALAGNGQALRGKPFIVYYWHSSNESSPADFAALQKLVAKKEVAPKNVALLSANLDETRGAAEAFLRQHKPAGVHIHAGGGLDGPTVQQYGLFLLPSYFLIGARGEVLAHAVDVGSLEAEIGKIK